MKKKKKVIFSLKKWLLKNYKKPGFNKKLSSLNLYNPLFIEAANQATLKKVVKQTDWVDQCIYDYFSTVVNIAKCIDDACHENKIMMPRIYYYSPVKILKLMLKLQEAFNNKVLFENFLHFKGVYEGCSFLKVSDYPIALFSKELFTRIKYPVLKREKKLEIEIPELRRDPKIEWIICPYEDAESGDLQSHNPDGPFFDPIKLGETPWAIIKNVLIGITSIETTSIPVINCDKNPWVEFLEGNAVTHKMIENADRCVNDGKFVNQWVKNALSKDDISSRHMRIDESIVNFPK